MLTRGIESGARMRLEATGSILTNHAGDDPILRSAGDMSLIAQGKTGVTGGVIKSNAGPLKIEVGQYGLDQPGTDPWLPGTLKVSAVGDVDIIELTDDLLLAGVSSSAGDVTLQAWSGSIYGSPRSFDRGIVHVEGDHLKLIAGNTVQTQQAPGVRNIGTLLAAVNVDANTLEARSHSALRAVIAVDDSDSLSIFSVEPPEQGGGLRADRGGQFLVRAAQNLSLDTRLRVGADAGGTILLEAATGTLSINEIVDIGEGVLSLIAGGDVAFAAASQVLNPKGRLDIESREGSVLQAAGSVMSTLGAQGAGGNVRILAQNDIAVASLDAGDATVALRTGAGRVLEAGDDAADDLVAGALIIESAGGVGQVGRRAAPIEVAVGKLAAASVGDFALDSGRALTVDAVSASFPRVTSITVDDTGFVSAGGRIEDTTVSLTGLAAGAAGKAASVSLRATAGTLSIAKPVSVLGGSLYLGGAAGLALLQGAGVASDGGDVTLRGGSGAVTLGDASTVATQGGDVVLSSTGALTMAASASLDTDGGDVWVSADAGAALGVIDARAAGATSSVGAGSVAIEVQGASGAITSALASGSTSWNVLARGLVLQASSGVGGATDAAALRTSVEQLNAVVSSGSIRIVEQDAVLIAPLASMSFDVVAQSGLSESTGRPSRVGASLSGTQVSLTTLAGSITVQSDPLLDRGDAIIGFDGITLIAGGADSDIVIDAATLTTIGVMGGTPSTWTTAGAIRIEAGRDIRMTAGSTLLSGNAEISLKAGRDIELAQARSSAWVGSASDRTTHGAGVAGGDLVVDAGRAISVAQGAARAGEPLLVAGELVLKAGTTLASMMIAAAELRAQAAQGSISLVDIDPAAGPGAGLQVTDVQASAGGVSLASAGAVQVTKVRAAADSVVSVESSAGSLTLSGNDAVAAVSGVIGEVTLAAAGLLSTTRVFTGSRRTELRSSGSLTLDFGNDAPSTQALVVRTDASIELAGDLASSLALDLRAADGISIVRRGTSATAALDLGSASWALGLAQAGGTLSRLVIETGGDLTIPAAVSMPAADQWSLKAAGNLTV
ncbi:MAG: hypothetical protein RL458_3641, partial [Pseudomonadota bacterium]